MDKRARNPKAFTQLLRQSHSTRRALGPQDTQDAQEVWSSRSGQWVPQLPVQTAEGGQAPWTRCLAASHATGVVSPWFLPLFRELFLDPGRRMRCNMAKPLLSVCGWHRAHSHSFYCWPNSTAISMFSLCRQPVPNITPEALWPRHHLSLSCGHVCPHLKGSVFPLVHWTWSSFHACKQLLLPVRGCGLWAGFQILRCLEKLQENLSFPLLDLSPEMQSAPPCKWDSILPIPSFCGA